MSEIENAGRKGSCFGLVLVAIVGLVLLLIYVYHHSGNAAPLG